MNIWLALALILAVIAVYMFTIETFSVAFKLTGLATNKIKFQVASLFTGAGFTTGESEIIVNDDKRRKIAVACMYTGHIFSVVIMGLIINVFFSLSNTLTASEKTALNFLDWYFIVLYVSAGLFLLVLFLKIPPINKRFQRFLENIALSASRKHRNRNIITVLDMYGKNAIVEIVLNNIPEFANEVPLYEMKLTKKYFINVLSIRRGVRTVEVTKDTMFKKGDILVIFGLISDIKDAFISFDKKNDTIVVNRINDINLVSNYGSNSLVEVDVDVVPKELDGIHMKDSHLSDRYSISIVVIKRNNEHIFVDKDTIIQKGDKLTVFGPYQTIKHLFRND